MNKQAENMYMYNLSIYKINNKTKVYIKQHQNSFVQYIILVILVEV